MLKDWCLYKNLRGALEARIGGSSIIGSSVIEALMISRDTRPDVLLVVTISTLSALHNNGEHVIVKLETASSARWKDVKVELASRRVVGMSSDLTARVLFKGLTGDTRQDFQTTYHAYLLSATSSFRLACMSA